MRRSDVPGAVATQYPAPQWMFFNEWAGLDLLRQVGVTPLLAPRLVAAAHTPALLLMEDLTPAIPLSRALQGGDVHSVTAALAQWGTALGQLHAATTGKQAVFDGVRDTLAPRTPSWGWVPPWQRTPDRYQPLVASVPAPIRAHGFASFHWLSWTLRETCDALALPWSAPIEVDLAQAVQALRVPGPFLAYTHGDPCAENCLLTEHGLRFVDFENGAYRLALVDAVFPRMGFPTCWNGQQIPLSVVEQIERHYRHALVVGCPEAADDRRFAHAVVAACIYWAVLPCQFQAVHRLTIRDPRFCPVAQQTVMRQRLIFRCDRVAQTTAALGCLEHLGELFHHMATTLQRRWPVTPFPFYPVFA